MYGTNQIEVDNLQIGNYVYSDYTKQWYIVSCLLNMVKEGCSVYALIRFDGQGYCYKNNSLDELKKDVLRDVEMTTYKDLVCQIK